MSPVPALGLTALSEVVLGTRHKQMLDFATMICAGSPVWRQRKIVETREVLAMAEITERLRIEWIDSVGPLRILFQLKAPVPMAPAANGEPCVADQATIGLTLREENLYAPQPGTSFISIIAPRGVWHSNVSASSGVLCLGAALSAGISAKELILRAWGALSMQAVELDEFAPAGVLNREAARYWRARLQTLPLTREPFLTTRGGRE